MKISLLLFTNSDGLTCWSGETFSVVKCVYISGMILQKFGVLKQAIQIPFKIKKLIQYNIYLPHKDYLNECKSHNLIKLLRFVNP